MKKFIRYKGECKTLMEGHVAWSWFLPESYGVSLGDVGNGRRRRAMVWWGGVLRTGCTVSFSMP